jgi:chromosome segregation ATPase
VLGASASADGDDRVSADLTLRATPAWMRVFRTRAEADAKDLGGRIDEAATQSDDLSTSIVDTEAAQRARAAERTRLTELMRRKTRDLDQTLQVEQAITQVQSDMDQSASELAAMKGRIVMQTVQIAYASPAIAGAKGVGAPLEVASRGFLGNFVGVLAALVTVASFLLPFALVGAPIAWWLARRKKAPAAPGTAG